MPFKKWPAFSLLFCICWIAPPLAEALPGYNEPWGKDADLKHSSQKKEEPKYSLSPLGYLAEKLILFHQNVLSDVDGPRSHFRPTSSRYMLWAIRRHGFLTGFVLGCDRLLRENDDDWVYLKTEIDGKIYKWDPPPK